MNTYSKPFRLPNNTALEDTILHKQIQELEHLKFETNDEGVLREYNRRIVELNKKRAKLWQDQ